MNDAEPIFTAAEIARVLGRKRQSVHTSLRAVSESGFKSASGNTARAWSLAALPERLRSALESMARAKGLSSASDLFGSTGELSSPHLFLVAFSNGRTTRVRASDMVAALGALKLKVKDLTTICLVSMLPQNNGEAGE